jgi:hypothetical protein
MKFEWNSVATAFDLVLDLIACDRLITGVAFPPAAVASRDAFRAHHR